MTSEAMEQKTAVFSVEQKTAVFRLGDLSLETVSAGHQMDDATRELPLIAGRFAGRHWIPEEVKRETQAKQEKKERPRRGLAFFALCASLAFLLLVGSLMVQARLTAMNEEAAAVSAEIRTLREENETLELERAEARGLTAPESASAALALRYGTASTAFVDAPAADKAAVLGVRRGQGVSFWWNSFVDTLGECFR